MSRHPHIWFLLLIFSAAAGLVGLIAYRLAWMLTGGVIP